MKQFKPVPLLSLRRVGVGLLAATTLFSMVACSQNTNSNTSASSTANPNDVTLTVRGCTPQNPLLPTDTNETCGGNILDASEAKLIHYNSTTAAPELDIAQSITTTDAITWDIKLKQGYKFQDGTEVKAQNFVNAWNWGAYGPNAQLNSYFFAMIKGYDDEQCTDAKCSTKPKADTMSGLKVVNDYEFTITCSSPTSNLETRLGYTAFAPQPDSFFADTSANKANFTKAPIAAGPYQVTQVSDTQFTLKKFAGYSGKYPGVVGTLIFKVYTDMNTAYADVVANNLDLDDTIPSDDLVGNLWQKDLVQADGSPRNGSATTGVIDVLSFAPAKVDPGMADIRIREALSMAIDRASITKTVFNGARTPATGWVSPVVDGYKAGACGQWCTYDAAEAKQLYQAAGGYPGGTINLWINGDGGHGPWATAVCNSIKNTLGLNCVVQTTPDFATLRDKINNRQLTGMYRGSWQMDYPSIENFLTPIYATGASSNDTSYSNPTFDSLLKQAAAQTDPDKANEVYQQAEALLGKDMPTTPLWYRATQFGWSDKIKSIKMTPFSEFDFGSVVLN